MEEHWTVVEEESERILESYVRPVEIVTADSESLFKESCHCVESTDSEKSKVVEVPPRKLHVLSTVSRTEKYLRERRIPELIRFLLAKVISDSPEKPLIYLEELLNDCMIYRSGMGQCPALFEMRHLEAIVKSFDPGNSGWLSEAQVRRAFMTIGVPPPVDSFDGRVPTADVLEMLKDAQEKQLFSLLTAGTEQSKGGDDALKTCSSSTCKCSDINV